MFDKTGLSVSPISRKVPARKQPKSLRQLMKGKNQLTSLQRTSWLRCAWKRQFFTFSSNLNDFIILDTPPSLGILMTSALAAADEVIIPLQCEWFGLEGLAKIVHIIDQIRDSGSGASVQLEGILMTMYDSRTNLSKEVVAQVKNFLPKQLYKTLIPRSIRIGEAPSYGLTIFEHDPNGAGAKAYEKLAKEFLARRK